MSSLRVFAADVSCLLGPLKNMILNVKPDQKILSDTSYKNLLHFYVIILLNT